MPMNLPDLKGNKKTYIIVGGAAAAFVVYRWYAASSTAAAEPVDETLDTGSVTDAAGGAYGPGNVQYGGADITTPSEIPQTNAEWTTAAVQALVNQGWDGMTVQAALGRFLTDQTVTTDQETIVRAAIAAAGNPPVGVHTVNHAPDPAPSAPTTPAPTTPAPTTPAPTTPAPTTPAPTSAPKQAPGGLRTKSSTATSFVAQWNAVPGATRYRVVVPSLGYDWQTAGLVHDIPVPANKRKTRITVQVYAGNNNQQFGPMAQYWSTTK